MDRGPEAQNRANPVAGRSQEYEFLRMCKELEWLRTLTHVAPVGIFRADRRGISTFVNEHWTELAGYSSQAAIGSTWELAVHPDDVPRLRAEWRRCLAAREPFRIEHRYIKPSGRIVWVLTEVAREVDGRGRTTAYTGMSTDITELRQMREELEHSHAALEIRMRDRAADLQRMARIVENVDDAVITTDLEGRVILWNRGAEGVFGYTAGEMIGQPVLSLSPEPQREEAAQLLVQVQRGGEIHKHEIISMTKAGAPIEILVSASTLRDSDGTLCGMWAIVRDITDRKSAQRRLQRLSWRLLRTQDEERRRLARELHDSTAQTMAALAMKLSTLAREESPLSPERRNQVLEESLALAEQVTSELRTTSYLLHPPLLDERGLPAALGWLADGFEKRSGIKATLEIAPEIGRMPPEIETALFRVAQESLHNVHRHSGSQTVVVRLARKNGGLRLEVRDRGSGPPALAGDGLGVGIAGMRERLLELGGTLAIEPNHPGTAVIAQLSIHS